MWCAIDLGTFAWKTKLFHIEVTSIVRLSDDLPPVPYPKNNTVYFATKMRDGACASEMHVKLQLS